MAGTTSTSSLSPEAWLTSLDRVLEGMITGDSYGVPLMELAKDADKLAAMLESASEAQLAEAVRPGSRLGLSALHLAAAQGKIELLQSLLDAHADPVRAASATDAYGNTPALWAAMCGRSDAVARLVAAAPDVISEVGPQDATLLHWAAYHGDVGSVLLLLAAAPGMESAQDSFDSTPIHWAARHDQADVARVLLSAIPGAAAKAEAAGAISATGRSPLHTASRDCHPQVLEVLLSACSKAAVLVPDNVGMTPLHLVVNGYGLNPGHLDCVRLLIQANPDACKLRDPDEGRTPLHVAARNAMLPAEELLLAACPGAAVMRDSSGFTPLHAASHSHRKTAAVVQLLLAAAPQAAAVVDAQGRSPLAAALGSSRLAAAAVLLAGGTADAVLEDLRRAEPATARHLYPDFVACRAPLTNAQWARIPSPCPGLGRALPAALACSASQACHLVRRLPLKDTQRLRIATLCLARPLPDGRYLPPVLLRRILLSAFDA